MRRFRRGMTLTEVLVAGAILTLLTLVFFNGIILSSRIARENAEILQAEGIAWDAVWMTFNEDYETLKKHAASTTPKTYGQTIELSESAAPELSKQRYAEPARLTVQLSRLSIAELPSDIRTQCKNEPVIMIEANVEWGAPGKRRKLYDKESETGQRVFVYRSSLSRVETW